MKETMKIVGKVVAVLAATAMTIVVCVMTKDCHKTLMTVMIAYSTAMTIEIAIDNIKEKDNK